MNDPVILRTYPFLFRTNAVILRTFFDRNFDRNGQKWTEMDQNKHKQIKTYRKGQNRTFFF